MSSPASDRSKRPVASRSSMRPTAPGDLGRRLQLSSLNAASPASTPRSAGSPARMSRQCPLAQASNTRSCSIPTKLPMACAWLPVTSRGLQPKNVLENGLEKGATLFYTCQWGSCSKPPGTRTPLPFLGSLSTGCRQTFARTWLIRLEQLDPVAERVLGIEPPVAGDLTVLDDGSTAGRQARPQRLQVVGKQGRMRRLRATSGPTPQCSYS